MHPNPTSGSVRFVGLPPGAWQVMVFDVSGARVHKGPLPFELDLSNLSPGVYQVRLLSQEGRAMWCGRLIKP
jgi:hypothetical protein